MSGCLFIFFHQHRLIELNSSSIEQMKTWLSSRRDLDLDSLSLVERANQIPSSANHLKGQERVDCSLKSYLSNLTRYRSLGS